MKATLTESPIVLLSPSKRIRAEVAAETVWIGATVYPECPVWRVWCGDRLAIDTSTVGLLPREGGPLAYGMRFVKATRHRPQTGIGPGREIKARFRGRDGRELEVRVRVTDLSAFCAVREVGRRPSRAHYEQEKEQSLSAPVCSDAVRRFSVDAHDVQDLSITRFPEGSVLLGDGETPNAERRTPNAEREGPQVRFAPNAEREGPQVRFAPSGKLIAFWRHGLEQHVVFFDRPGDLAERRFGALERVGELVVADGRQGCNHLFLTVPFTKAALPAPLFGEGVTPAYRAAFEMILGRGLSVAAGRLAPPEGAEGAARGRACATDPAEAWSDYCMLRGEPGEFAMAARREGGVWQVAGVTASARTLTVRFEELWLRMPSALRALAYAVEILRDPITGEAGDCVEESFAEQAPDVRVALDLAKSGGFLITFRPQV
jgi:hypothetical protein